MEAFIGTIFPWPMNWAPDGWALCNGQILPISQYQALFSLIGNYYGGDGRTNFALPNLCGRIPVGMGQLPGGQNYPLAANGGAETSALTTNNLPAHNHGAALSGATVSGNISSGSITNGSCSVNVNLPANATNTAATVPAPDSNCCLGAATYLGKAVNIYSTNDPNITLKNNSVTATGTVTGNVTGAVTGTATGNVTVNNTGNGQPVPNMQPYLVLNYIICMQGLYPPRP